MRVHRIVAVVAVVAVILSCAAALSGASISGVTNAAGTLPPGLPNSGVAQGAIFAVYGAGLGPSTLQKAPSFPLPTTQGLAGTTVSVTVDGATETCIMIYTSATQVAGVLPSATPVGTGTLTVTYQGASASIAIQVLAAGFGIATLNGSGTGPASVTDLFYNPITMVNPAHPGDNLILWGTGLGAVSGDETEPPAEVDLGTGVQVFIENQPAAVLYGGRSGDPGLDQINFTVPVGIGGGCKTSVAVLLKGVVSNVATMAVAQPGQSTCGDSDGALTAANLQKAVATGTLNAANVTLYRFGSNSDMLESAFVSYPLDSLIRSYGGSLGPSIGSCTAYESLGTSVITDPIVPPFLDAGPSLALNGPGGTKTITASATGYYSTVLGAGSSYIEPGSYSVSNGSGGGNVTGFDWTLALPNPIAITNLPSTVDRAQDLTVTWSNSAPFSVVSILGVSGVPLASGQISYVQFYCTASASAGQFTIPSVILELLPTNGYGATGVPGVALEIAGIAENGFTVAGSPGIDVGVFDAFTFNGGVAKVQ
jgi:uncharacterized protein (TIGR03437 family)